MLIWCGTLLAFWIGYCAAMGDERDMDGALAGLVAIPTILTILYLCVVGLGFK